MKIWNRIKVKVLAFGIIMSIVPLASLGYLNVRAAEQDMLVSIQQRNTDLVKGIAIDIGQVISGIEDKISAAGNVFGEAPRPMKLNLWILPLTLTNILSLEN